MYFLNSILSPFLGSYFPSLNQGGLEALSFDSAILGRGGSSYTLGQGLGEYLSGYNQSGATPQFGPFGLFGRNPFTQGLYSPNLSAPLFGGAGIYFTPQVLPPLESMITSSELPQFHIPDYDEMGGMGGFDESHGSGGTEHHGKTVASSKKAATSATGSAGAASGSLSPHGATHPDAVTDEPADEPDPDPFPQPILELLSEYKNGTSPGKPHIMASRDGSDTILTVFYVESLDKRIITPDAVTDFLEMIKERFDNYADLLLVVGDKKFSFENGRRGYDYIGGLTAAEFSKLMGGPGAVGTGIVGSVAGNPVLKTDEDNFKKKVAIAMDSPTGSTEPTRTETLGFTTERRGPIFAGATPREPASMPAPAPVKQPEPPAALAVPAKPVAKPPTTPIPAPPVQTIVESTGAKTGSGWMSKEPGLLELRVGRLEWDFVRRDPTERLKSGKGTGFYYFDMNEADGKKKIARDLTMRGDKEADFIYVEDNEGRGRWFKCSTIEEETKCDADISFLANVVKKIGKQNIRRTVLAHQHPHNNDSPFHPPSEKDLRSAFKEAREIKRQLGIDVEHCVIADVGAYYYSVPREVTKKVIEEYDKHQVAVGTEGFSHPQAFCETYVPKGVSVRFEYHNENLEKLVGLIERGQKGERLSREEKLYIDILLENLGGLPQWRNNSFLAYLSDVYKRTVLS